MAFGIDCIDTDFNNPSLKYYSFPYEHHVYFYECGHYSVVLTGFGKTETVGLSVKYKFFCYSCK